MNERSMSKYVRKKVVLNSKKAQLHRFIKNSCLQPIEIQKDDMLEAIEFWQIKRVQNTGDFVPVSLYVNGKKVHFNCRGKKVQLVWSRKKHVFAICTLRPPRKPRKRQLKICRRRSIVQDIKNIWSLKEKLKITKKSIVHKMKKENSICP